MRLESVGPTRRRPSQGSVRRGAFAPLGGAVLIALGLAGCGDDGKASVEFTPDACEYSGPTEFDVGAKFELTAIDLTEERADVGYAVTKVHDGTTVNDISELGIEAVTADDEAGGFLWSEVAAEGATRTLSTSLDIAGTWSVHCFVFGDTPADDAVLPATTFEVT